VKQHHGELWYDGQVYDSDMPLLPFKVVWATNANSKTV